jgi:hypothetical protein
MSKNGRRFSIRLGPVATDVQQLEHENRRLKDALGRAQKALESITSFLLDASEQKPRVRELNTKLRRLTRETRQASGPIPTRNALVGSALTEVLSVHSPKRFGELIAAMSGFKAVLRAHDHKRSRISNTVARVLRRDPRFSRVKLGLYRLSKV